MSRADNYSKKVNYIIFIFKGISILIFILLGYSLFSVLSASILNTYNLLTTLKLVKKTLFYLLTSIFRGLFLFTRNEGEEELLKQIVESIFFGDIRPSKFTFSLFLENLKPFVSGTVILILLVVFLFSIGFIKTGEYEYVLWSFLLVLLSLLLGLMFLPNQLHIPQLKLDNLSYILSTSLFRSLLILYFFLVIGQQLSFFSSVFVPLSNRAKRITSKITSLEKIEKKEQKEETQEQKALNEQTDIIEQLSAHSRANFGKSRQNYSFTGKESKRFVSSKLRSFVEKEKKKKRNLIDSLAGKGSLPDLKRYFILALSSFAIEIVIFFPLGIFALISPTLIQRIPAFSEIFIFGEYEMSVFIIFTITLSFIFSVEISERIFKGNLIKV